MPVPTGPMGMFGFMDPFNGGPNPNEANRVRVAGGVFQAQGGGVPVVNVQE